MTLENNIQNVPVWQVGNPDKAMQHEHIEIANEKTLKKKGVRKKKLMLFFFRNIAT